MLFQIFFQVLFKFFTFLLQKILIERVKKKMLFLLPIIYSKLERIKRICNLNRVYLTYTKESEALYWHLFPCVFWFPYTVRLFS